MTRAGIVLECLALLKHAMPPPGSPTEPGADRASACKTLFALLQRQGLVDALFGAIVVLLQAVREPMALRPDVHYGHSMCCTMLPGCCSKLWDGTASNFVPLASVLSRIIS